MKIDKFNETSESNILKQYNRKLYTFKKLTHDGDTIASIPHYELKDAIAEHDLSKSRGDARGDNKYLYIIVEETKRLISPEEIEFERELNKYNI
jgi:hypothetical protein